MKQGRYAFLDGMRGIAAICVVIRHTPGLWNFTLYRSYLAVDLFFLLSGFVIAHAYDEKLSSRIMSFPQFAKVRLVRLYPIYILSILACVFVFFINPYLDPHAALNAPPVEMLLLLTAASALFIPFPVTGMWGIFPLNAVYWSLLYELMANFAYAFAKPILTDKVLYVVIAISMAMIVLLARHFGHLDVGSSTGLHQIAGGLARSAFGFFTGLFFYRKRDFLKAPSASKVAPWLAVITVAIILSVPRFKDYNELVDLIAVFVVFPLAVVLASRAEPTRFTSMLLLLGTASYPLYVLHTPVAMILGKPLLTYLGMYSGPAFLGIMVGVAVVLERIYDVPVRRWLMRPFPTARLSSRDSPAL